MSVGAFHCHRVRVSGEGVFAREELAAGEVVELAPVVVLEPAEGRLFRETSVGQRAFALGDGRVAVGLGYASVYRLSPAPNAAFEPSQDGIRIVALRAIRAAEEITRASS